MIWNNILKQSKLDLEKNSNRVQSAGRIVLKRVMGKVSFMTLEDTSGRLQAYFSLNNLGDSLEEIKDWDLGDFVGIKGNLFRTKTDSKHSLKTLRLLPPQNMHHKRNCTAILKEKIKKNQKTTN